MLKKTASSSLDLYGKIPLELNEATEVGGLFSMGAAVCMFLLFYIELVGFLQYTFHGIAIVGSTPHNVDNPKVIIMFNVTMLALPCEYAAVDVVDVVGHNLFNVTGGIQKTELGANSLEEVSMNLTEMTLTAHAESYERIRDAVERYGTEELLSKTIEYNVMELNEENIHMISKKYPWIFVNFFHGSSIPSRDFMPIWDDFANYVEANNTLKNTLMIGVVDCNSSSALCTERKIFEFPTIKLYHRNNPTNAIESPLLKTDGVSVEYLTKNVVEHFINFDKEGQPTEVAKKLILENLRKLGDDRELPGCNILGYVEVNAVPGNIHIEARSPRRTTDINPQIANLSHVVHAFKVLPSHNDQNDAGEIELSRIWKKVPERYRQFGAMNGYTFIADELHIAIVHHTRLVYTEYHVHSFYDISKASRYQMKAMSGKLQLMDFDSARTERWSYFIIKVMAILGGTYSVVGLADAICERLNPKTRDNQRLVT